MFLWRTLQGAQYWLFAWVTAAIQGQSYLTGRVCGGRSDGAGGELAADRDAGTGVALPYIHMRRSHAYILYHHALYGVYSLFVRLLLPPVWRVAGGCRVSINSEGCVRCAARAGARLDHAHLPGDKPPHPTLAISGWARVGLTGVCHMIRG